KLVFDLYIPGKNPVGGYIVITDSQSVIPDGRPRALGTFESRYDTQTLGKPGKTKIEIDITGLTTNGGRALDLKHIRKFLIDFGKDPYYVDNIRLEKEAE